MGGLEEAINYSIDGLPSSGKDTITSILLYVLNEIYENKWTVVDSSQMWRATSWFIEKYHEKLGCEKVSDIEKLNEISPEEYDNYVNILNEMTIETDFVNKTVTVTHPKVRDTFSYKDLQSPENDLIVGYLATLSKLRPLVVNMERNAVRDGFYLVPGRDGLKVLNDEDLPPIKGIYPYTNLETRAKRRFNENIKRYGESDPYETILEDMRIRSIRDSSKSASQVPFTIEEADEQGYLTLDNSKMNIYDMGVAAVNLILPSTNKIVSQTKVEELVFDALKFYDLKIPEEINKRYSTS